MFRFISSSPRNPCLQSNAFWDCAPGTFTSESTTWHQYDVVYCTQSVTETALIPTDNDWCADWLRDIVANDDYWNWGNWGKWLFKVKKSIKLCRFHNLINHCDYYINSRVTCSRVKWFWSAIYFRLLSLSCHKFTLYAMRDENALHFIFCELKRSQISAIRHFH